METRIKQVIEKTIKQITTSDDKHLIDEKFLRSKVSLYVYFKISGLHARHVVPYFTHLLALDWQAQSKSKDDPLVSLNEEQKKIVKKLQACRDKPQADQLEAVINESGLTNIFDTMCDEIIQKFGVPKPVVVEELPLPVFISQPIPFSQTSVLRPFLEKKDVKIIPSTSPITFANSQASEPLFYDVKGNPVEDPHDEMQEQTRKGRAADSSFTPFDFKSYSPDVKSGSAQIWGGDHKYNEDRSRSGKLPNVFKKLTAKNKEIFMNVAAGNFNQLLKDKKIGDNSGAAFCLVIKSDRQAHTYSIGDCVAFFACMDKKTETVAKKVDEKDVKITSNNDGYLSAENHNLKTICQTLKVPKIHGLKQKIILDSGKEIFVRYHQNEKYPNHGCFRLAEYGLNMYAAFGNFNGINDGLLNTGRYKLTAFDRLPSTQFVRIMLGSDGWADEIEDEADFLYAFQCDSDPMERAFKAAKRANEKNNFDNTTVVTKDFDFASNDVEYDWVGDGHCADDVVICLRNNIHECMLKALKRTYSVQKIHELFAGVDPKSKEIQFIQTEMFKVLHQLNKLIPLNDDFLLNLLEKECSALSLDSKSVGVSTMQSLEHFYGFLNMVQIVYEIRPEPGSNAEEKFDAEDKKVLTEIENKVKSLALEYSASANIEVLYEKLYYFVLEKWSVLVAKEKASAIKLYEFLQTLSAENDKLKIHEQIEAGAKLLGDLEFPGRDKYVYPEAKNVNDQAAILKVRALQTYAKRKQTYNVEELASFHHQFVGLYGKSPDELLQDAKSQEAKKMVA